MNVATIAYPHVTVDDEGIARLGKTRYKVLHLACTWPASITIMAGRARSFCDSIPTCGPKKSTPL